MRKILFGLIIITLLLLNINYDSAEAESIQTSKFIDITNHWAEKTIIQAESLSLLKGYGDGTFRPNKTVTRGEFAAFLGRATVQHTIPLGDDIAFADVSGHWSENDIRKCISLGFIIAADYPNGFNLDQAITRGEISKWMANGLSSRSEDYKQALIDMKDTYVPVKEMIKGTLAAKDIPTVGLMMGTGLLTGFPDLTFGLEKNTSRAEVATILLRYMDVESKNPKDFLGLRELREVGTAGSNLTTITPLSYGYNVTTNKAYDFKNIMNKPRTLENNVGTVVVHKLIAIEIRTAKDYTGIYGKMFISDDYKIINNTYYFFTLSTVIAHKDKFNLFNLINGTGAPIQSGGGLWHKAAIDHELPTIPQIINDETRYYFKKSVPMKIWGSFAVNKDSVYISAKVDDGSIVTIGDLRHVE